MQKKIFALSAGLALLFFMLLPPAAIAQDSGESNIQHEKTWGAFLISGTFGTQYLFKSITGDSNLFRSQFNLKEGLNIGQISFRAYRNPKKKAFLDAISLDIRGFGAEPYGRAFLSLERKNVFSLSGGYTERKFYSDVASFANPLFNAGSETVLFRGFHTWDTTEKIYDIGGRLKLFSWMTLNASWQHTNLDGDSLTTLRLLNNEFPLSEPVNQANTVIRLGSDITVKDWLSYSLSGIYQKFNLDQTTSTSEANVGIRGLPSGVSSTYLTSQSRRTQVKMETWATDHTLKLRPLKWLNIEGSAVSSRSRGHSSGKENINGQFIWPLYDFVSSASLLNAGSVKKDLDSMRWTARFLVSPQFRWNAGFDYYSSTIDNTDSFDYSFTRSYYNKTVTKKSAFNPYIGLKQNKYFLDASYTVSRNITAGTGFARSVYTLQLQRNLSDKEAFSYKLNAYYGALQFRLSKHFSLKTTAEKGDYNNVFARLIPLKSTSLKLDGKFLFSKNITGSLFFKSQKLDNTDFSYTSSFNAYGGNLNFNLSGRKIGAALHVSRNDLSSTMDIIRFVSMFTEIADVSKYTSDVTLFSGSLWFKQGFFSLDAGYSHTKVTGTFPIRIDLPYARAIIQVLHGFAVTFHYRYFSHTQNLLRSQTYKASLFNIGFTYDF